MIRTLQLSAVALLAATVPMQAALLLQTPSFPFSTDVPDNPGIIGYVARVDVGAAPVSYNQIGVFGRVSSQLDMKFVIAEGSSAPVVISQTSLASETSPSWHLSDVLAIPGTLNANTTYHIGFVVQGGTYFANFNTNSPPPSTQNGLTQVTQSTQVHGTFAAPTISGGSLTQFAIQIYGPDAASAVPEPSTYALLAFGLLAIARKRS